MLQAFSEAKKRLYFSAFQRALHRRKNIDLPRRIRFKAVLVEEEAALVAREQGVSAFL
ncbi:hypothetical protein [Texcoconibacillus texcoconensis]|uniref:Uncharacterized protein n=1 Tax=Texcoconibacillus texcoconensis TaxID=1095777 RepID=A0A840QSB5_9BACI|nr:hypothetical protein [Texcoconibacillus texcoconensis]MBB5174167.1 hypothetical protein [Texcoconibacillus texcoconensis]